MTDLIAPGLLLASRSAARRAMLSAAGLAFAAEAADVDEDAIRRRIAADNPDGAVCEVAPVLAAAKAEEVSRRHPGALVIGCDQILALDQEVVAKAPDMAAAHAKLMRLAGRTHALHCAVALAIDGATVWQHREAAMLAMRALDAAQISAYLAQAGGRVLDAVGCYELEGLGVNLFERIEGDYFTILGMPLLPLLGELRRRGITAF